MVWRALVRRLRVGRTGPVEFSALIALALYMAAVQAFGVEPGGRAERVVYWLVCIVGGGVIGAAMEPWLERVPLLAARPPLRGAVMAVTMTVPVTLLVWFVTGVMVHEPLRLRFYVDLFPNVLVVNCAVVAIAGVLRRALAPPTPPTATAEPTPVPNPLSAKLPPRLARSPIVAVEADDHYLRVYTLAGEGLVYMKFGDALGCLAEADGLQVHRSWWVARARVEEVRLKAGRGELSLACGVVAPVSRSFADRVRDVDWAAPRPVT